MDLRQLDALRVLVVDDQSHVRNWVRGVLGGLNITNVAEASDGNSAYTVVTRPGAHFDLLLVDLHMPGKDGIELIRALAQGGLECAVAIMSTEDERVIETASLLAVAEGLHVLDPIQKPVTVEKLMPILVRVIEGPRPGRREDVHATDADLHAAFEQGEMLVHYQPKVELATGRFVGAEAIVRWRHPTLGLLRPPAFMAVVDKSKSLSRRLLDFTVSRALVYAGRWRLTGQDLCMAVNLATGVLGDTDLPERIEGMAVTHGVQPGSITLEIAEAQVAQGTMQIFETAMRLKLKGFQLAVDEFGAGQSTLAQLQRMPFSELKVSGDFVDGCAHSVAKRAVVSGSVALARTLKLTTAALGLRTASDRTVLGSVGCDAMQGFFVAAPMSEEGLEPWAAQWSSQNHAQQPPSAGSEDR